MSAAEAGRKDIAVLIVHVDGVERMCASIGHVPAGDMLNLFFAGLKSMARAQDAVERISDRKFALLLAGMRNRGHIELAARKVQRIAKDSRLPDGEQHRLHVNIGVALYPTHGADAYELLRLAEIALLDGRRDRQELNFFEQDAAGQMLTDWGMEKRLEVALELGCLELHYQPKICVRTGRVTGAEGLMRWQEPDLGWVSPDVLIELAESTGQIAELTHYAIQCACRQLAEWRAEFPELFVAVNITPTIIRSREIVEVLKSATTIWGVPPGSMTLEVTENALLEDRETSHGILIELRDLGVRISIDDFGTGYSSLAYLKEIPADELKIDRSFVMGMLDDSGDYMIVQHTVDIARSFGLSVVAEGVENEAILDALRKLGCDYGQGYHFSKALPAQDFIEFCREHR